MYYRGKLPSIITEEETVAEYEVMGLCGSCDFNTQYAQYDYGWIYNKKSKKLHFQGKDEFTLCGKDATGESWLWQL